VVPRQHFGLFVRRAGDRFGAGTEVAERQRQVRGPRCRRRKRSNRVSLLRGSPVESAGPLSGLSQRSPFRDDSFTMQACYLAHAVRSAGTTSACRSLIPPSTFPTSEDRMIDWAAAHFGTGLGEASALRSRVLEALGVEREWLSWDEEEGEDTVSWITGPLATAFSVRPASSLTPDLGVLHISTQCAWVDDLLVAEEIVAGLNLNTTVSRWVLRDQPQPSAWSEDDGVPDAVVARRQVLLPEADPSSTPAVHLELCVVTGEGVPDLPLTAVVTAVREQIAKATAVATLEVAGLPWSPAVVSMAGRGARGADTWNDIVYHYDNVVTPAAEQDARPLLHALTAALSQAQAELQESGSAVWEGSGDEVGLTCEVPYGAGPFSYGLVGVSYPAHLRGDEHKTSLVEASAINHSQLGRGLMLTLRPGGNPVEDGPEVAAELLNQQHSAGRISEAAAHGWGAWIVEGYFMHALFLPAAWATVLDAQDLLQLMRCLLNDAARLSRLSRVVLEPLCDVDEDDLLAGNLPSRGFAAGFTARGPEFGEPGAGTAPGARMLAQLWRDLVAATRSGPSSTSTRGSGSTTGPTSTGRSSGRLPARTATARS